MNKISLMAFAFVISGMASGVSAQTGTATGLAPSAVAKLGVTMWSCAAYSGFAIEEKDKEMMKDMLQKGVDLVSIAFQMQDDVQEPGFSDNIPLVLIGLNSSSRVKEIMEHGGNKVLLSAFEELAKDPDGAHFENNHCRLLWDLTRAAGV